MVKDNALGLAGSALGFWLVAQGNLHRVGVLKNVPAVQSCWRLKDWGTESKAAASNLNGLD